MDWQSLAQLVQSQLQQQLQLFTTKIVVRIITGTQTQACERAGKRNSGRDGHGACARH